MTDNEIKKALECCIKSNHFLECFKNKCPCVSEDGCAVGKETLYPYALDLINRQQAEIERLQNNNMERVDYFAKLREAERKKYESSKRIAESVAIKEFAERVKMAFYYEFDELIPSIMADKIDNIVKEMEREINE